MIEFCELCPRRCGANRDAGKTGYCGAGREVEVFRYGPHPGEEPPISGERGSGTVFFSRCTLRCIYCQNHPWSQGGAGRRYGVGALTGMLEELAAQGCHNWNLVSPTPWLPQIASAVEAARRRGVRLPVVYNTSGFERTETLREAGEWVDVYLTDLRYSRPETGAAGSGCAGYVDAARAALLEMWRQKGPLTFNAEGLAVSGVICRILVLPGHAEEAVESLEWLAAHVGPQLALSVMAQYTPVHRARQQAPWDRGISAEEYGAVCEAVESNGFENGWVQEFGRPAGKGLLGAEMESSGVGDEDRHRVVPAAASGME